MARFDPFIQTGSAMEVSAAGLDRRLREVIIREFHAIVETTGVAFLLVRSHRLLGSICSINREFWDYQLVVRPQLIYTILELIRKLDLNQGEICSKLTKDLELCAKRCGSLVLEQVAMIVPDVAFKYIPVQVQRRIPVVLRAYASLTVLLRGFYAAASAPEFDEKKLPGRTTAALRSVLGTALLLEVQYYHGSPPDLVPLGGKALSSSA
jgi:hypothetical protein